MKKYSDRYFAGFTLLCDKMREELKNVEKVVNLNNPERSLKLGYSIATINGKIIRKIKDAKIGQSLELKVSDGTISSQINNIEITS